MDIGNLGGALLKAGAPMLKSLIENSVGGLGGKLAGAAIDALASELGTQPTPTAIAQKIESDPVRAAPVIQRMEEEVTRSLDIGSGDLTQYISLLRDDTKREGIIARLWRPLFALAFTACYTVVIFTMCWLMWSRQWGTLSELGEITGFLTFAFVAGCAVLGVQIWKRTEEKKSGVS